MFLLAGFAWLAAGPARVAAATWLTDVEAARARLMAENKPLLLLFTGSDWSPAGQLLNQDVFNQPEFQGYADTNLILMVADFPRRRAIAPELAKVNAALAKEYHVEFLPTIILLDGHGQEVVRLAYRGAGLKDFMAALDTHVRDIARNSTRRPAAPGDPTETARAAAAAAGSPLFNGALAGPPPRYKDLILKTISGPRARRLALINNQTFSAGEAARVRLNDGEVKVRCVEIRDRSVLVSVEGQAAPRELVLNGTP